MASAFLSRTLFSNRCVSSFAINQNSQKLPSLLFKKPLQAWASSTPTAQRRFTLVCSDMASTMRGSTACFLTQSVSTGEPDLKVEKNIEDQTHQHIDAGSKARDAGETGATVNRQELYSKVLPKLREKGFFDVPVDVASSNAKFNVKISLEATVHSFKSVLEQTFEIPAGQQCLICQGDILEDDRTLKSYGLTAGHKVYTVVMGGPLKNQAPPTPDPTAALASPASYFQDLYDTDPDFREVLKYPDLFRQFCSTEEMTEEQMKAINETLSSGRDRTES